MIGIPKQGLKATTWIGVFEENMAAMAMGLVTKAFMLDSEGRCC